VNHLRERVAIVEERLFDRRSKSNQSNPNRKRNQSKPHKRNNQGDNQIEESTKREREREKLEPTKRGASQKEEV
jgi:hypothetical protein